MGRVGANIDSSYGVRNAVRTNSCRLLQIHILVVWFAAGSLAVGPGDDAAAQERRERSVADVHWTQQGRPDEPSNPGRLFGRWWRGSTENQKNHADVKSAYSQAAQSVAASTVRILSDGKSVALGTVVDSNGYLVTKASLLEDGKKYACRIAEGNDMDAAVVGVNNNYDLALLKVEGQTLTVPEGRSESPASGTFVAALDTEGKVIGVGVVSTEPRAVSSVRRPNPRRGWLGVDLGGGETGTGVTSVINDSAARRAGLKEEDRIKSIDAVDMTSMQQIIDTIGSHAPGDAITLLIQRGEEELSLSATLGKPAEEPDPQDEWGGGPFSARRDGFPEVITHDTIVLPSQCGGPLVDTDGKVVGVNIARALRVSTYAVPWDKVLRLVEELKRN